MPPALMRNSRAQMAEGKAQLACSQRCCGRIASGCDTMTGRGVCATLDNGAPTDQGRTVGEAIAAGQCFFRNGTTCYQVCLDICRVSEGIITGTFEEITLEEWQTCSQRCLAQFVNLFDRCTAACLRVPPTALTTSGREIQVAISEGVFFFFINGRCYYYAQQPCEAGSLFVGTIEEMGPNEFRPPRCQACECCDWRMNLPCMEGQTCCQCGQTYSWTYSGERRYRLTITPFGRTDPNWCWPVDSDILIDEAQDWSSSGRRVCVDSTSRLECIAAQYTAANRTWNPNRAFCFYTDFNVDESGCDGNYPGFVKLTQCAELSLPLGHPSLRGFWGPECTGSSVVDDRNPDTGQGRVIRRSWTYRETCGFGFFSNREEVDWYGVVGTQVGLYQQEVSTLVLRQTLVDVIPCAEDPCEGGSLVGAGDFL